MSAIDREAFPRGALIAAGALIFLSLGATAAVRIARINAPPSATRDLSPPTILAANLRFIDTADGSVVIKDAQSDRLVATVAPGEGGFIRGVMRGLARDRISRHIGPQPPFQLTLDGDQSLWLLDMATGRRIDLQSFGSSNRAAFLRLLKPQG